MSDSRQVTEILRLVEDGDHQAAEELLPLVYDELRRLAGARLASENSGNTLQATALVHEAYLRLVDVEQQQHWNSRGHLFGVAAEAMRRILVEAARRKGRVKHGGGLQRIDLDQAVTMNAVPSHDLLTLDEALTRFEAEEPEKARLVKLRFFSGLTNDEAAELVGVSAITAKRHWRYARAWLHRYIFHE